MICLESWTWLEYVFDGNRRKAAEAAIETADSSDEGGIVLATVVTEVAYQMRRQQDAQTAAETIDAVRSFEHIDILPVTDDTAEYAAALQDKYYRRGDRALSYADSIYLAMAAVVTECETLHSGDPDFEGVDGIETVIL